VDGVLAVVKAVSLPSLIGRCQIATEIENLLNLRHPPIAPLIGFPFPVESGGRRELKTARFHASGGSLADILLNPPASASDPHSGTTMSARYSSQFRHGIRASGVSGSAHEQQQ
jgi:hypothetical protein